MSKTYRSLSHADWATDTMTPEKVGVGALQRIAQATEAMAKNYTDMQRDLKYYEGICSDQCKRIANLEKQVSAYKGHVTRLKKLQADTTLSLPTIHQTLPQDRIG